MTESDPALAEVLHENEHLKAHIEELDDVLRAIRSGEVDAIVGSPETGGHVFTLASAETPYRHFVENMDQGACIFDSNLTILYCNKKFADIVGRVINTLIGSQICDSLTSTDTETCRAVISLPPGEILLKDIVVGPPDGEQTPVQLDVGLLEDTTNGRSYSAILTDLSLLKKNETVIQAENFSRSILENIGDAVFVCDPGYIVIRANHEASRVCGCNPVNKPFPEIMPLIQTGPEGSMAWVPPSPGDNPTEEWAEVTLPAEEGPEKILMVHTAKLKDVVGHIIGWVIDVRDLSEIRRFEEALQSANKKLNLLSEITRHDILNQISVLFMALDMALDVTSDPDQNKKNLERCLKSAETISRIITFTRNYQELGVKAPVWNNISHIVQEASRSPEFANLSVTVDTGMVEILTDPMIVNVFRNFFDNAIRHGKASKVTISGKEDEDAMVIAVEDDGCGIPSDKKAMIFSRGFGEHTGFGLFLAREILDMTGCTLRETGISGSGAYFEIRIPLNAWRRG